MILIFKETILNLENAPIGFCQISSTLPTFVYKET